MHEGMYNHINQFDFLKQLVKYVGSYMIKFLFIYLQNQKRAIKMMIDIFKERRSNPENHKGDLLDQILEDMQKEKFWTKEFAIYVMFGLNVASFETISSTLTLAIKFLIDNPSVVDKMTVSNPNMHI